MKTDFMSKRIRRYMALLMCFVMLLGTSPTMGTALEVRAGGDDTYYICYYYYQYKDELSRYTASMNSVSIIQNNTVEWGEYTNYYKVTGIKTIHDRVQVSGDVKLILCDGCTLTCEKGIHVPEGSTLRIYAQSEGKDRGKLIVNGAGGSGIGGNAGTEENEAGENSGDVFIYGGDITISSTGGAGIGGGDGYGTGAGGAGGGVTIFAGSVNIHDVSATGIGGGNGGSVDADGGAGEVTTIHGGDVTIAASSAPGIGGGAGIGSGYSGDGTKLTITGGRVSTTGIGCSGNNVGTVSHGSITLGWRNAGDSFHVDHYDTAIDFSLRDNKDFWYRNNPSVYTTVVTGDERKISPTLMADLNGKTLYPKDSYAITKPDPVPGEHGSVSIPVRAFGEEEVSIKVSPDAGYSISLLTVIKSDGEWIDLSGYGNDYSFTMPGGDVNIPEYTFVPAVILEQPQDLTLTEGYADGNRLSIFAQTSGPYDLSYNWYKEGQIEFVDSASECRIPRGKGAGTTEYYYCMVSVHEKNGFYNGIIRSRTAKVEVVAAPVYYTVSFNMMGHGAQIQTRQILSGNATGQPVDPSENGYLFGGWYKDKGYDTAYDFANPVTSELTLYAKWTKYHSVSFNMMGHGEQIRSRQVLNGSTTERPTDPVAEGVVFDGWYTDPQCTGAYDFNSKVIGDLTLYAKWTSLYSVSYDMRGHGEQIPAEIVRSGNTASRPEDPFEEGYRFDGWFSDEKCSEVYSFDTPVTKDITVYAGWTGAGSGKPFDPLPYITEDTTELYLVKGQKFTLPMEGWTLQGKENKKYLGLSKKGMLKAKKAGNAVLCRMKDGNIVQSISVNISKPAFDKMLKLKTGGSPVQIKQTYDKERLSIYWHSSSPDVATVTQEGVVEPVSAGKTTVTAFINGCAYRCSVKVKEPEPAKERTLHMATETSKTLNIKGIRKPVWSSASANIASVSKNKLTANTAGETVLTAVAKDGGEYKVHLTVEDIHLKTAADGDEYAALTPAAKGKNKYNITLKKGDSFKLEFASVKQAVYFKSSDQDKACADEKGMITTHAAGKTKLTTKINGKTVTVNVEVKD